MEIKVLDILQTLCIGAFSVTLIIFFYFLFNKCFVKKKFDQQKFFSWISDDVLKGENLKTGYLSLALILVYFLGNLASDLTERMTDSNNNKERSAVLKELNWLAVMPSVGEIRKLALIDSEDSLTTLGNSVFSSYILLEEANKFNGSRFFLNTGDTSLLPGNKDSLIQTYMKDPKFDRFIALLFYTSKNWCYSKEHEPLRELKSIQNRIDLSRSTVLISSVALQLIVLLYVIFFFYNIHYFIRKRKSEDDEYRSLFKNVSYLILRSAIIFLVIGILCRECFQITLLSYNKRAYGYYTSYLAQPETIK